MNNVSLKIKLIVLSIFTVIAPVIILGFFSIKYTSDAIINIANDRAIQLSEELADIVDITLQQELKMAHSIAFSPVVVNTIERVYKYGIESQHSELIKLDEYLKELCVYIGQDYELIVIADKNGLIISDTIGSRNKNIYIQDRDYFINSMNGESVIGTPTISTLDGIPTCVVSVPIKNKDNEIIGMFGLIVKLDVLYEKISTVKIGETGYAFMVDKQGMIITHPNKDHILKTNISKLNIYQKKGIINYEFDGVDKIAGFSPVSITEWRVGVTQTTEEFMRPISIITNTIIGGCIIFSIVVLFGILYFTNIIILPIKWIINGLGKNSDNINILSNELSQCSKNLSMHMNIHTDVIHHIMQLSEKIISIFRENTNKILQESVFITDINTNIENIKRNSIFLKDAIHELEAVVIDVLKSTNNTNFLISKDKIVNLLREINKNITYIIDYTSKTYESNNIVLKNIETQHINIDSVFVEIKKANDMLSDIHDISKHIEILSEKFNTYSGDLIMNVTELIAVIRNNNGKVMF